MSEETINRSKQLWRAASGEELINQRRNEFVDKGIDFIEINTDKYSMLITKKAFKKLSVAKKNILFKGVR